MHRLAICCNCAALVALLSLPRITSAGQLDKPNPSNVAVSEAWEDIRCLAKRLAATPLRSAERFAASKATCIGYLGFEFLLIANVPAQPVIGDRPSKT